MPSENSPARSKGKEILHMGPFTESMTRLCGEIVALRGARLTFVRDLGQDVATMKADFRRAHADMGRRTKAEAESKRAREVAERDRLAALAMAKAETERRAKAEAERHAKAEAESKRCLLYTSDAADE